MKLNNRFLFGILSILLAAIIAFVALPTISRQTNGKTEIVRVTQPVLKGAAITDKDVEIVEVGSYNLPSNIAVSKEDVVGRYTFMCPGYSMIQSGFTIFHSTRDTGQKSGKRPISSMCGTSAVKRLAPSHRNRLTAAATVSFTAPTAADGAALPFWGAA